MGGGDEEVNTGYLDLLHQGVHASTDHPEDTMTVALTQAEMTAICLGAHLTRFAFPCLEEVMEDMLAKFIELVAAQRPDWAESEYWGQHGAE